MQQFWKSAMDAGTTNRLEVRAAAILHVTVKMMAF